MNKTPTDLLNIIWDYKYQLEHIDKYYHVIRQLNFNTIDNLYSIYLKEEDIDVRPIQFSFAKIHWYLLMKEIKLHYIGQGLY